MRNAFSLRDVACRVFENLAECERAKSRRGWQRSFARAASPVHLKWSSLACLALAPLFLITADVEPAYSQSNACNLAVNGSFESPNIQTEPDRPGENTAFTDGWAVWRTTTYPLDGWQTVSGTVDILRHYNNASDGMQSIDLWGTAAATVRQTFTGLVPGQQYTFSVDYSGLSATQSIAAVQLGNGNGATPVTLAMLQPVADAIPNGGAGLPTTPHYSVTWATYQYTFDAVGTEATVQFVNNAAPGPSNTGLFIDNFTFAGAEPCADLSITKDDGATTFTRGSNVTYTIVVSNDGTADAPGAQISDPLPAGITTANWTCGSATGGATCGAASGTGAINTTADLPAGSSVTYSLTLTVPPTYPGVQLTNTATVTAPDGITDPDTSNNTASDTNVVAPPQPSFGACDSTLYLAQGIPTGLFEFNTSSNPFIVNPVGPASSGQYNAIAMHPTDGYIYGIRGPAPGTVVRVGSDGSVVELGTVTGFPLSSVSGEIGPDGTFYVAAGGSLYRINLETMSATSVTLSQNIGTLDIAWHNGLLYTAIDSGNLYAIDPANGNVTTIGLTGTTGPFGAMFGATNGVYGGNNNGGFYQFDLTTGAATLISDLQGSGSNDGALCVNAALDFPVDLAITKDDGSEYYEPGTDVVYTIVVSNNGPFGVQNALVNDALPAGITQASWTCGTPVNGGVCGTANGTGSIAAAPVSLPVGGSVTFTLTMTVPEDFEGDLVNTATVTAPVGSPDQDTSNNSSTDTNVPHEPGLTVEKTGTLNDLNGNGLIDPGETITYSFLVRNTGTVTLTDVTVNDPLLIDAGISVTPGPQTLAPGGSVTFTATYQPTQADIDSGSVTNTATATGTTPGGETPESPPDTVTVPPSQDSGLTIEKTGTLNDQNGNDLIDPGETITYSFLVTNTGAVTLTGVTVNDPLLIDAGVALDQGPQTLAPGQSFTFTATYEPTQADIDSGSVTNTATATGTPPDPEQPPTESPPDTVTVPPSQEAGLTIEKTGTLNDLNGNNLIDPGETITYSFLVTNTGAVTLTDVTVNDPLLQNAGIAVTPGPQTLAPGGSVTFTATYEPTQADIDSGSVTNTATGTGTPPDGPPTESPPDTVTVPPSQESGLTIQKSGQLNDQNGNDLIDPGETITYSFLVTNTGAVTLTDVTVNDPLLIDAGVALDQGPQTLAPGESFTFTATYEPTQADIDSGSVTNTATATGTPPDPEQPPTESPPDTVTVPPSQETGLTVEKTGTLNDLNGNGLIDPGETITYSFLVTNTGAVTLTDVTVNDPLLIDAGIDLDQGPQTLAPGESFTFTATYQPTQADIDAGSVTNTATATGTSPDPDQPPTESPPDTVTVPAGIPGLHIEKSGVFDDVDGNGATSVGDTIRYSFTVTNTGNVVVADVSPQDPGPTFNGQPGTGSLSAFTPTAVTLQPGEQQVFTAIYALTQADIDNAAGVSNGVENTATALGYANGNAVTGTPVESEGSLSVVVLPAAVTDISVAKIANLRAIRRGEQAPFTIRVTNHAGSAVAGITVTDIMPAGFRYVAGSASVDEVAVEPEVAGRELRFTDLAVAGNGELVIRLRLLALSTAGPGEHVNRAVATGPLGERLAPEATAVVEILAEHVFDCGDIIGKVFDDRNRNGYQDEGEPGLAGVRLATVKGWLITTDEHGRFHVPCAALPDSRIGSNFIMKLDERTLPSGYRLTTENPRVVRLTAGKMTRLNFGAAIGRVVRLDLADAAFVPGGTALTAQWAAGLEQLIAVLEEEQSVLRLSYFDGGGDAGLAEARVRDLKALIAKRWGERRRRYPLDIETRVEAGQ